MGKPGATHSERTFRGCYRAFLATLLLLSCSASTVSASRVLQADGRVATQVRVATAAELVAALADPAVDTVVVTVLSLTIRDQDFDSQAEVPIVLRRNVTLTGAPELPDTPILRLLATDKIKIGSNIWFTMKNLAVYSPHVDNMTRAPHLKILAVSDRATGRTTFLCLYDMTMFSESCNTLEARTENIRSAMAIVAGAQAAGYLPADVPTSVTATTNQSAICDNSSSMAHPTVPMRQRCWPDALLYNSVVVGAYQLNAAGTPEPTNYIWRVRNMFAPCMRMATAECVAQYGPVGCNAWTVGNVAPLPIMPIELPGPNTTTSTNTTAGLKSGVSSGNNNGTTDAADSAAAAAAQQDGAGGGDNTQAAIIIGCVVGVGGAALVLAAAALLVVLARRRRSRRDGAAALAAAAAAKQLSSSGEAAGGGGGAAGHGPVGGAAAATPPPSSPHQAASAAGGAVSATCVAAATGAELPPGDGSAAAAAGCQGAGNSSDETLLQSVTTTTTMDSAAGALAGASSAAVVIAVLPATTEPSSHATQQAATAASSPSKHRPLAASDEAVALTVGPAAHEGEGQETADHSSVEEALNADRDFGSSIVGCDHNRRLIETTTADAAAAAAAATPTAAAVQQRSPPIAPPLTPSPARRPVGAAAAAARGPQHPPPQPQPPQPQLTQMETTQLQSSPVLPQTPYRSDLNLNIEIAQPPAALTTSSLLVAVLEASEAPATVPLRLRQEASSSNLLLPVAVAAALAATPTAAAPAGAAAADADVAKGATGRGPVDDNGGALAAAGDGQQPPMPPAAQALTAALGAHSSSTAAAAAATTASTNHTREGASGGSSGNGSPAQEPPAAVPLLLAADQQRADQQLLGPVAAAEQMPAAAVAPAPPAPPAPPLPATPPALGLGVAGSPVLPPPPPAAEATAVTEGRALGTAAGTARSASTPAAAADAPVAAVHRARFALADTVPQDAMGEKREGGPSIGSNDGHNGGCKQALRSAAEADWDDSASISVSAITALLAAAGSGRVSHDSRMPSVRSVAASTAAGAHSRAAATAAGGGDFHNQPAAGKPSSATAAAAAAPSGGGGSSGALPVPQQREAAGAAATRDEGSAAGVAAAAEAPQVAEEDILRLLPVVRGRGAFGRVVEGIYRGERVAVKMLLGPGDGGADLAHVIEAFMQEVEVLGRCSHPNVVKLLAACLDPRQPCLVMELCDTSLEGLIFKGSNTPGAPPPLLPLSTVLYLAIDMCNALSYLHPTIIHRDLKPANVLINNPHSRTPHAKLTDFGLSRLRTMTLPTEEPEAGTAAYMAPECFDVENNVVTHHADLYSLGVIIWTMLSGRQPWSEYNVVAVAFRVCARGERLPLDDAALSGGVRGGGGAEAAAAGGRCPPKLARLLTALWDADPLRRPAAEETAKKLLLIREELEQQHRSTGADW
ncbi:hypothetical protein HXX76_003076 [Chlamydomonas incerta]|uniref:Protein kinase domain-containing protein n=1 Tax=Chlamydomonas incerta TaxID=51695 RepID=A0A835TJ79_CHLIN|nr:hypothetical protein HXX76_003076 [Chlamydomonas incerta]|eukprot:KAG2441454.1 hypothetical protein HXX76_003076 [Chlamydomonas incerta]